MSIPTGSLLPRVRGIQPCCADIQMFIRLLSTFIQGFRWIAAPLTSQLKTTGSSGYQPRKRSGLRTMRLSGVVVELMKRLWTRLTCSKNRQKSKNLKSLKNLQRLIGSEEPSLLTSDTRLVTMENYWPLLEAFQKWNCKHEILVLACYCSLQRFRDTKSSSFRRVCWTQELSRYQFRTDYQLGSPCQPASLTLLRA